MFEQKQESGNDVLIRLRPGIEGRLPVYFVHPTHGNGLCYGPLAVLLGNQHPVHAFRSVGLLPSTEPDQTIEQMAQRYAERILSAGLQGPCILGGWSQGALIALEMAKILPRLGRKVAHMIAIDNMFITIDESPETGERIDFDFLLLNLLFQQVTGERSLAEYKTLNEEQKLDYLLEQAYRKNMYSAGIDPAHARKMLKVFYFNCLAGWHYDKTKIEPDLEPLPVTFFFATEDAPFERERKIFTAVRNQFKEKRAREKSAHWIEGGDHFNLLSMPHVKNLSQKIAATVQQVEAEYSIRA